MPSEAKRRPLDFVTTKEVAEAAGVTAGRIRKLCQQGRLAAFKIGGQWLILEHSAYEWVNSPRQTGRPPGGSRPKADQLELDIEK